ncbi:MAG: biopolymer transporter ExbD [Prevotella sp.]|nr:biopolymer transporter ExbD [Prevotella sp.]
MGKIKIQKKDVWIDMTPMSDVMTLLLCFFMLTSTFVKNEAVKVQTPASISEIKVPETNVLTVIIDDQGKVFLGWDSPDYTQAALDEMTSQWGISLTPKQIENARKATNIGVSMNDLSEFLMVESNVQNVYQKDKGVPTDSIDGGMSEFQQWVMFTRDNNGADMKIALKGDEKTSYKVMKKVMSELQDMNENRYYLITTLKTTGD